MKVIFLDIDGVLNSASTIEKSKGLNKIDPGLRFVDNPDPEHIEHLNFICEQTGAKVVISSAWRRGTSDLMLWRLLQVCGFRGHVIGKTPTKMPGGWDVFDVRRGDEIKQFIKQYNNGELRSMFDNKDAKIDKITHFVILDDDDDMCELMDHLVQTDADFGLQHEHALKAIEILNKD